jgi:hypothetical protein
MRCGQHAFLEPQKNPQLNDPFRIWGNLTDQALLAKQHRGHTSTMLNDARTPMSVRSFNP